MFGLSNKVLGIASGIAGTTVVAGGATAIYLTYDTNENKETKTDLKQQLDNPKPANEAISSLLTKNGLKLLAKETGDDVQWKANWQKFKTNYASLEAKEFWTFETWDETESKSDDATILETRCIANNEKEVENINSPLYKTVVEYCTKKIPTTPIVG